jgi:hypothetical protein
MQLVALVVQAFGGSTGVILDFLRQALHHLVKLLRRFRFLGLEDRQLAGYEG